MASQPLSELAVIDILNTIVDRVKQTQPATTTGKPLSGDLVYSQLILGMPIDPRDYANAWTPMGGDTGAGGQTAGVPAAPPAAPGATPAPDPKLLASLQAAFKTSQLCNIMLQVTDDGSYLQYPIGRHLAFQYNGILGAMQPLPVPPQPAAVQAEIAQATAVLYTMDNTDPANPVIIGKSQAYERYERNALAYATAKAIFAMQEAATLGNPATASEWPLLSSTYQEAVDDAYDTWKTEGAAAIETALATYESQGINMQQSQIAAAKKQFDIWSLGLAGVPTDIPYSYVDPSEWCDPNADDIGFESLTIKRTSGDQAKSTVTQNNASMYWNNQSSSVSQSAHASGFFGIGGGSENSSNADQHSANGDASGYQFTQDVKDQFTDLEISLEWALVTIYRPWLISDLFYMNNWYIQGEPANCVSDGKIQTQVRSDAPMLPMIPQQMLVVRNVTIKSSSWGDNTQILNNLYNNAQASTAASQSSAGGSASVGFGPFGGGGANVQTASNSAGGQGSSWSAATAVSNTGTTFDGTTLAINGAQVIAFLSNIVPPSPGIPDPALPKPKAAANNNDAVTTPAGMPAPAGVASAPAGASQPVGAPATANAGAGN
jgi:hypothetical protein